MMQNEISVIIPCRNEEKYISIILDFVVNAKPVNKELIIVDGDSTDGTRKIIDDYVNKHSWIKVVDNPAMYVPFALNKGMKIANGKYIVRLDAHTEYADDYFLKVIETFEKTGAEIVGGPMRAVGKTPFQRAVAVCTSTSFGVGDSKFHDETYSGYTDSVYLGAWRRGIFDKTGMFDEQMLRNQDDEFHYRAKSHGMKIYLNPEIRSWYYPRSNFRLLARQYFQYGLFKPLVLKKVKSEMKIRHLIPSAFTMYLFFVFCFLFFVNRHVDFTSGYLLSPLILYLVIDVYFSFSHQQKIKEKFYSIFIYPMLHLSYGSGFLLGLTKRNRK